MRGSRRSQMFASSSLTRCSPRTMRASATLLLVTGLGFAGRDAAAATLFSNLGQSSAGTVNFVTSSELYASEFDTGVNGSTLTGLSVRITNSDTVAHTFKAFVYSSTGTNPNAFPTGGGLLTTFTAVD